MSQITQQLNKLASKQQANILQRFFKTGKGEYGEGDIFIGLKVPQIRQVVKQFKDLPLTEIKKLLSSKIHEYRACALFLLVAKFETNNEKLKDNIYKLYLANTKYINNWDLVDLSAPNIVGQYLLDKPKDILYSFAVSKDLWEKRISMISTYTFIKNKKFVDTLKIAKILLNDEHDLIHKAVGWMLREVGKRDLKTEENFLKTCYKTMPRTMLRYAIERFPEAKRQRYLKGTE
ncbi:MAG: DNA alkylation repair protein [Candidatus Omnitrophica bacterium]|nr:DNA alkylation repair protein [Candidatus Omnitrophota bacterium]